MKIHKEGRKILFWMLVGLILFLISWATLSVYHRNLNSRIKQLETDKNKLKAELYDMERGLKTTPPVQKRVDVIEEDKDGSGIRPRENFK